MSKHEKEKVYVIEEYGTFLKTCNFETGTTIFNLTKTV
jgi:hypothetical protein